MSEELTTGPMELNVGFIGGGNMAYALASGFLNKGVLAAESIWVSATNLEKLRNRWSPLGVTNISTDNREVAAKTTIVFICVKPQIFPEIVEDIKFAYNRDPSFKKYVSIMAGVTLDHLQKSLPFLDEDFLLRAMPNTPIQVGVGCTVFCRPPSSPKDVLYRDVEYLFESIGLAYEVKESQMDAVTGLAGCGPAYVYEFIEALADGGVKQGIPRDMALKLAAQTVMGAAKTVLDTGKHPAVLKDEVCSPGGATIHGVHALEQGSMRSTVMNAVERATERAAQLS
ncbi:uncharacterized protein LOC125765820 [Anopheles funestus]|uniref:uncharacterized protein LOC125765820 n=1 Tax=Anopheles funestus TaxID=62324 RepID=UPI0020C69341|nr:uncharacterized protein LOC125765820 [Anopheles funestus]